MAIVLPVALAEYCEWQQLGGLAEKFHSAAAQPGEFLYCCVSKGLDAVLVGHASTRSE